MTRAILIGLAMVLVLLAGAALWAWQDFQNWQNQPVTFAEDRTGQAAVLFLPKGSSYRGMLNRLDESGADIQPWRWRLLARLQGDRIQAGEYRLDTDTTPLELLNKLRSGDVIRYSFTIIEGWTLEQLLQELHSTAALSQSLDTELLQAIAADKGRLPAAPPMQQLMAELGSDKTHGEGWFLPETYFYVRGDRDIDILKRAHQAMQAALKQAWEARDEGLPLETPEELLVLASIVEKETGLSAEREAVAGVFIRRLQKNMRLQTDPTVIYGIGARYDGDIRTRDLREDTPYNTYVHAGLPPTPIALPSEASLMAAARPAEGTALYFVATGDGGHVFADTLAEHNRNVRAYLRRQRQNRQP